MKYWEVPKMPKATRLKQLINVFSPFPLTNENFDEFYVDTTVVRGIEMEKLKYTLMYGNHQFAKILFSGHIGSGKTTELYNLAKSVSDKYEVITISVLKDLDIYNMSHVDLIFEIMSSILLHFENRSRDIAGLRADAFSQLYNIWHSEHFITTIFTDENEASLESSAGASGSVTLSAGTDLISRIKFLIKVAMKGQSILKTSTETKDELKTKLEPRMGDLIAAINSVTQEINSNLGGKELLIIIEDLDKADQESVNEIFTKHFTQLSDINVKMIFNIPISLEYSLSFKKIKDNANANFVLNAINVANIDGTKNTDNIQFFKKFVYKRAEEKFFDDKALDFMIEKSGGILRDLFAILVDASINADLKHPDNEIILMDDAEAACMKLRNEYVKSIEKKEQYDTLLSIYRDPSNIFEDDILLKLLQANLVIECGEYQEYQVHPLVIDYMIHRGDIEERGDVTE